MNADTKSVITCDLEGRIETFSEGAASIFGWTPAEVIGKKRVSLFSPGEVVLEHVPKWLSASVAQGSFETDSVFVTKTGERFPAHIKITPTKKNGAHVGYCGVTQPLPASELARAMPKISAGTRAFRWLVITRAPFLTATLVPVAVAAAWAAFSTHAAGGVLGAQFWAMLALVVVGACALHVAANTFNDVFDWKSGADQDNNDYFLPFSGGSRSIELGLITLPQLARVAWTSLAVAALCGVLLALFATPVVIAYGVVGAFAAYFYTAPPLRLAARRGLGELLIAVCFGPLMTAGTFAALTAHHGLLASPLSPVSPLSPLSPLSPSSSSSGFVAALVDALHDVAAFGPSFSTSALLLGIPVGLLCAAILFINEVPDAASDARAGKNHLVVTFGKTGARVGYVLLTGGAFVVLAVLVAQGVLPKPALVALLAAPLAVRATWTLLRHYDDRELIVANKSTIQLHAIAGVLLAVALVLS